MICMGMADNNSTSIKIFLLCGSCRRIEDPCPTSRMETEVVVDALWVILDIAGAVRRQQKENRAIIRQKRFRDISR